MGLVPPVFSTPEDPQSITQSANGGLDRPRLLASECLAPGMNFWCRFGMGSNEMMQDVQKFANVV